MNFLANLTTPRDDLVQPGPGKSYQISIPGPAKQQQPMEERITYVSGVSDRGQLGASWELGARAGEVCSVEQQLMLQKQYHGFVKPEYQKPVILRPVDSHYYFNPLFSSPLPKNQTSFVGFLEQYQQEYRRRIDDIQAFQLRRQAVVNRLNYLKQVLQGSFFRPSQIKELEESRKKRSRALELGTESLTSFTAEQVGSVLLQAFVLQQEEENDRASPARLPPPSPLFVDALRKMSVYYVQIFAKLNITEEELRRKDFERVFYEKVHSKYPTELAKQPIGLRNVTMKPYQMDGLRFLVSMFLGAIAQIAHPGVGRNVPGVCVADDMGLGKTLQTIAFIQYLHEKRLAKGPHLIVAPLAVSDNWLKEFQRFAPDLRVLLYKGQDRERMRRELIARRSYYQAVITTYDYAMADRAFFKKFAFEVVVVDEASRIKNCKSKLMQILRNDILCRFRLLLSGTPLQNNIKELFTLLQFIHGGVFNNFEQFDAVFGRVIARVLRQKAVLAPEEPEDADEEETGTNAQSDPDLAQGGFTDIQEQSTLTDVSNAPTESDTKRNADNETTISKAAAKDEPFLTEAEKVFVVQRLHGIIKPFMIRRVKLDVLDQLPPKEEIILRVPLSGLQAHLYGLAIQSAGRVLDQMPLQSRTSVATPTSVASTTPATPSTVTSLAAPGLPSHFIRNVDMYLRKVCNHPFAGLDYAQLQELYLCYSAEARAFRERHAEQNTKLWQRYASSYTEDKKDNGPLEELFMESVQWRCSGKLTLLKEMLEKMRLTGHRVLVFSQFKLVLDILEQFAKVHKYMTLRFDGDVKDEIRVRMVSDFNRQDSPYFLFLLSTRAASHGLNLQSADTVIIYDCDFNAFYDLQAQDRVYRIGQTKPVKVFKLYTTTVLEQKMLQFAQQKLHMASTVIDAGAFAQRSDVPTSGKSTRDALLEVFKSGQIEQEDVHILQGAELNRALARGEAEFRQFENYDQQKKVDWENFCRGFEAPQPQLIQAVPGIFSKQEADELRIIQEKFFSATANSDQDRAAPSQAVSEKIEPMEQQPLGTSQTEPKTAQEGQQTKQRSRDRKKKTKEPEEASAEEEEEQELLVVGSIQNWVPKDLYFTMYEDLRYMPGPMDVYKYIENLRPRDGLQEKYGKHLKLFFRYMAQDVALRFTESCVFQNVCFVNLMCGIKPDWARELQYVKRRTENASFYEMDAFSPLYLQADGNTVEVFHRTEVNRSLTETFAQQNPQMQPLEVTDTVIKAQLNFAVRCLSILHVLYQLNFPGVDYTKDGSMYQRMPYKPMFQLQGLPDRSEYPGYYQAIQNPISFHEIWLKAATFSYLNLASFVRDVETCIQNCVTFNGKESFLAKLADAVKTEFNKHLDSFFDEIDIKQAQDPSAAQHPGDGLFDSMLLDDQITHSVMDALPVLPADAGAWFGSGYYGGNFYESFVFDIIKHISARNRREKERERKKAARL